MAKIKNCAFCGTEITTGLFNGTAEELEITQTVLCCPDCYRIFKSKLEEDQERIETKIKNFKRSGKVRLSDTDIATMVKKYFEETKEFEEKNGQEILTDFYGFFNYNENGYFNVYEFSKGSFLENDGVCKDMVQSKIASETCDTLPFTKNDITKLEYKFASKLGDSTGLFSQAHSFEIRLNDEKKFTYKPCITRYAVIGKGLFPFLAKRNAEKQVVETLQFFKQITGSELPIVKVKKFK